jgi:hypothetical protein
MKISVTIIILIASVLCFATCQDKPNTQKNLTPEQLQTLRAKGAEIVSAAFNGLSTRLQTALKEGGVPHAVHYCNIIALPITDSLSSLYNATIKRTGQKIRNPENRPSALEIDVFKRFQQTISSGNSIQPELIQHTDNQISYFAPIMIMPQCLQCHGTPGSELKPEYYELIKKSYPEDEAIGFREGDLRGIWSITFKKQE